MNLREGIGIRQQMIMQCIWQSENPPTVLEIIDMLEERCGQRLATSTITTLCQGLSKRGYIHQGPKRGHAYTYEALIEKEDFFQGEIRRMRKVMFQGSVLEMVGAMLREEGIGEEDMRVIQGILLKYGKR